MVMADVCILIQIHSYNHKNGSAVFLKSQESSYFGKKVRTFFEAIFEILLFVENKK